MSVIENLQNKDDKKAYAFAQKIIAESATWTSFDAYFGTVSFGKKYLNMTSEEILVRHGQNSGVSRYRVLPEYLPEA